MHVHVRSLDIFFFTSLNKGHCDKADWLREWDITCKALVVICFFDFLSFVQVTNVPGSKLTEPYPLSWFNCHLLPLESQVTRVVQRWSEDTATDVEISSDIIRRMRVTILFPAVAYP